MGGSSYSDDSYKARSADRAARGVPTFDYSHKVASGAVAAKVHDKLNPKGIIRESRDSEAHPESLAIAVICDETGSMAEVPRVIQEKIPKLMGLLIRGGYVEHPQVLFGAVGDAISDQAPLQIGQFESGAEMDDDINLVYLEGNGGGGGRESYQNVFYFFAKKTSIDCFEKRGKKGYLFMIGDESPYQVSTRAEIMKLIGDDIPADIPVADLVKMCQEKYNIFFLIPESGTNHGQEFKSLWQNLLGFENVITLKDVNGICEVIAATVGLCEGTVDADGVRQDMHTHGTAAHVVGAVVDALAPLAAATSLVRVGSGDLPAATKDPGTSIRL